MSKFALLFLVSILGGVVATFAVSPSASFLVYQVVYFLNPEERWWSTDIPALRYSFLAVLLMMSMLIFRYRKLSELSPWNEPAVLKWMLALLVMYYIAYLFALAPVRHHQSTFEFTKLVIIVLVAYKLINSEKAMNASLWAYLVGCTYIGYLATITGRNSGARLEGIGMVDSPDANGTAAALVPATVFLMYFAWQGSSKVKVLAMLMGALIANGLVLFNSRGAFLGVVISLGLFVLHMIFSRHQKKGQRLMAVLMIAAGLGGALYVTDELFWERMSTLANTDDQQASGSKRIIFWLKTFEMLDDHPFGMGIFGYNTLAPVYMDEETRGAVLYRSVHSTWFQGLSEVGYIGFAIFIGMLVSLARLSRRAKFYLLGQHNVRGYFQVISLECALLGYLASASFMDRFRAEILYWMILFLAVAINVYFLQHVRKAAIAKLEPSSSDHLPQVRSGDGSI